MPSDQDRTGTTGARPWLVDYLIYAVAVVAGAGTFYLVAVLVWTLVLGVIR